MQRMLLAILVTLGMALPAWADSIIEVVGATTTSSGRQTAIVFNDAGATIVSGAPVAWDTDDTEYDRSGYPYIVTTTTADSPYTAGIMLTGDCADQTLCEIITAGYAHARVSVATLTEDTVVSTSTTASSIGDATAGNNVCYLGTLIEYVNPVSGGLCTGSQVCLVPVQVNITCVP